LKVETLKLVCINLRSINRVIFVSMTFPTSTNRFAYCGWEFLNSRKSECDSSERQEIAEFEQDDDVTFEVESDLNEDLPDENEETKPLAGCRLLYITEVLNYVKQIHKVNTDIFNHSGTYSIVNGWIEPPEPCMQNNRRGPEHFCYPKLFVWNPQGFGDDVVKCYKCRSSKGVISNGWPDRPIARRVVGLDSCYFIVSKRYKCKGCNMQFNGYNEQVLAQMPEQVRLLFPCFLTHRSALDHNVLTLLRATVAESLGPGPFQDILTELHKQRYEKEKARYLGQLRTHLAKPGTKHFFVKESPKPFPDFDDPCGYGGFIPSSRYLVSVCKSFILQNEAQLQAQIAKAPAEVLSADETFKVFMCSIAKD
jgi:hypothetical protein